MISRRLSILPHFSFDFACLQPFADVICCAIDTRRWNWIKIFGLSSTYRSISTSQLRFPSVTFSNRFRLDFMPSQDSLIFGCVSIETLLSNVNESLFHCHGKSRKRTTPITTPSETKIFCFSPLWVPSQPHTVNHGKWLLGIINKHSFSYFVSHECRCRMGPIMYSNSVMNYIYFTVRIRRVRNFAFAFSFRTLLDEARKSFCCLE